MDLQINRWGNSLALRLPAKLARELNVDEGSHVQATVAGPGRLILQNAEAGAQLPTREAVIAELDALHQSLPQGQAVVRALREQGY